MKISMIWVRHNAQLELRDNLRTAIKEAGLTQSEAARRAGVKYTHLTGFLSGNNWLTSEALDSIAPVLELSVDELLGASIFKHQCDQYERFNFRPPEWARAAAEKDAEEESRASVLAEPPENRARALCCTCGNLRLVSTRNIKHSLTYETRSRDYYAGGRRQTWDYKCDNCGETTPHAVLRVDDARDAAEDLDHAPTKEDVARQELRRLVDRLAEFNVDVHFRRFGKSSRLREYTVRYQFDESKSQWRIEIAQDLPTRLKVSQLAESWRRIAKDDHGCDWDARDGVVAPATDYGWGLAADDLVADIGRFLGVERRRMVQQINDEIATTSRVSNSEEVDW